MTIRLSVTTDHDDPRFGYSQEEFCARAEQALRAEFGAVVTIELCDREGDSGEDADARNG